MPDLYGFMAAPLPDYFADDPITRALDTAALIAQRPFTVVLTRFDTNALTDLPAVRTPLIPQVIRIEVIQAIRGSVEVRDLFMNSSQQNVVLIGYRGHPTIPNTDMQRADQFFYQNRMYEIIEIIDTVPGILLASCELTP